MSDCLFISSSQWKPGWGLCPGAAGVEERVLLIQQHCLWSPMLLFVWQRRTNVLYINILWEYLKCDVLINTVYLKFFMFQFFMFLENTDILHKAVVSSSSHSVDNVNKSFSQSGVVELACVSWLDRLTLHCTSPNNMGAGSSGQVPTSGSKPETRRSADPDTLLESHVRKLESHMGMIV